jgi:hypothetical protein
MVLPCWNGISVYSDPLETSESVTDVKQHSELSKGLGKLQHGVDPDSFSLAFTAGLFSKGSARLSSSRQAPVVRSIWDVADLLVCFGAAQRIFSSGARARSCSTLQGVT